MTPPWPNSADLTCSTVQEVPCDATGASPASAAAVATLRDRKLARIGFRYAPVVARRPGAAVSFLSPRLVEEFQIPDEMPVSAHPYSEPVEDLIRGNRDKLFLDVGAGLRPVYYDNVVNLDIYRSLSTDVISIAEDMPFTDAQFDFVLCFAVLEHVRRPWQVAGEMGRVLRPGGTVIVDYPFMSPVHAYPHHYFNATPLGHRSLFEGFCDITSVEIGWHQHPAVPLRWMLTVWRNGLPEPLAAAFSDLKLSQVIEADLDTLLTAPYCRELHPEMMKVIAGGSMLTGVKRSDDQAAIQGADAGDEVSRLRRAHAELAQTLAAIHASTSWRLTAPLRSLGRLLGRGPAKA